MMAMRGLRRSLCLVLGLLLLSLACSAKKLWGVDVGKKEQEVRASRMLHNDTTQCEYSLEIGKKTSEESSASGFSSDLVVFGGCCRVLVLSNVLCSQKNLGRRTKSPPTPPPRP